MNTADKEKLEGIKDFKLCLSCRSHIHPDARICQYCQSTQYKNKWQLFGSFLKWIGGISVVLSLIITMVQVNDIYNSFKNRQRAVLELVQIGNLQRHQGEYEASWNSYKEAIALDPGNSDARNERVKLAMIWLRNMRVKQGERRFTDIVDQVSPILFRGIALSKGSYAADLIAHLGWATFLKFRDGRATPNQIEQYLEWAISIDPKNPYAHVMQGFWILYSGGDLDSAQEHFNISVTNVKGQDKSDIRSLQLAALFNRQGSEFEKAILQVVSEMQKNGEKIYPDIKSRISQIYEMNWRSHRWKMLSSFLPPEDHLMIIHLLKEDGSFPESKIRIYRFLEGIIQAEMEKKSEALSIFRSLQSELKENQYHGTLFQELEEAIQDLPP